MCSGGEDNSHFFLNGEKLFLDSYIEAFNKTIVLLKCNYVIKYLQNSIMFGYNRQKLLKIIGQKSRKCLSFNGQTRWTKLPKCDRDRRKFCPPINYPLNSKCSLTILSFDLYCTLKIEDRNRTLWRHKRDFRLFHVIGEHKLFIHWYMTLSTSRRV